MKSQKSQIAVEKSQFAKCNYNPLLRNASNTMKSQHTNAILNCEFNNLLLSRETCKSQKFSG